MQAEPKVSSIRRMTLEEAIAALLAARKAPVTDAELATTRIRQLAETKSVRGKDTALDAAVDRIALRQILFGGREARKEGSEHA